MEWKRLQTPPYILLLLWSVAFEVTVVAFAVSRVYADWLLVYTLGLASATALAGTDVALWVQAYYSRLSQDRQFQLDFQVRWWENIYAPLYEETLQAIQSAEEWRPPYLGKWIEIKTSRFGHFVESTLAVELDRANDRFLAYSRLWQEAHTAVEPRVRSHLAKSPLLPGFVESVYSTLASPLIGDNRFVFDPSAEEPGSYAANQFRQTLRDLFHNQPGDLRRDPPTEPQIHQLLKDIKGVLRDEPTVQKVDRERESMLELAQKIHDLILRRMPVGVQGER